MRLAQKIRRGEREGSDPRSPLAHLDVLVDGRAALAMGVARDPFGIAWDDISRVLGRKSAGLIAIELQSTAGTHLLLYSDWHEFAAVIEAITARLAHIIAGVARQDRTAEAGPRPGRRGWAIASESPGPDGVLVTAWHRIGP
jgi:hypothetical protein